MNNIEKLAIEVGAQYVQGSGDFCFMRHELEAFAKAYAQQSSEPVAWVRVIDEELVMAFLDVADVKDSYEDARNKLNKLLAWHIDVATDPLVNGGYKLVKVDDDHPPASVPVEDAKVQDLILELKCLGEVLAMEMTTVEGNPIAPVIDDAWKTIERLVATQSASVPLEKYNKLLDALKASNKELHNWDDSLRIASQIVGDSKTVRKPIQKLINENKQLIAEAELSEGKEG